MAIGVNGVPGACCGFGDGPQWCGGELLTDLLAKWQGPMPRSVSITDCGSHASEYVAHVLSRTYHPGRRGELLEWEGIVDSYQACPSITKLADAIFGPGRQTFVWAAKQRKVLKRNLVAP